MARVPFPTPAPVSTGILHDSAQSNTALHDISLPLIGADTPTQQNIAQLNTRFDGTATGAVASPPFPTVQT